MTQAFALEGTVVAGRYEVVRKLGAGGMGAVYLGRHVSLKREVAIKFIHPELASSEEVRRRFDIEAKAAARIKSRHAVSVIDHGVASNGQPFIVMEYLEGESLEQAIRRLGRLPFEQVVEVIGQAARALEQAHAAGIIHRDLKPDNIFLAHDREAGERQWIVKVLDFGIAKVLHDEAVGGVGTTKTGMVLGTPLFMSPEALTASAPVSPASDIWSLGACAFAAACGRVPFEGEAIGDVVLKVCAAPMPVPSALVHDLPPAFDQWFKQACARDLSTRFRSVAAMADALLRLDEWALAQKERVMYEIRPLASIVDVEEEPPRASSRGLVLAGVLAGAAMMLGALGYYVVQRTRAADATAAALAASAATVIEAENERKLREADRYFWSEAGLPVTTATADAGVGGPKGRRPKRRPAEAGTGGSAPAARPEPSAL
jgi:serine/threonine-protein kinase